MDTMKDLLNKRFGKLVAIEHLGKLGKGRKYRHRWKCKCDCGTKMITQSNHLLSGDTRSCGCLNLRCGKDSPLFAGYGEIPLPFYKKIQTGCARHGRNIVFKVSIEYLWELFLKQNRRCALTGIELSFDGSDRDNKYLSTSKRTASLDRIDSSEGYIEGNVQWIHKDVNRMKLDMDEWKFVKWCHLIAKNKPLDISKVVV